MLESPFIHARMLESPFASSRASGGTFTAGCRSGWRAGSATARDWDDVVLIDVELPPGSAHGPVIDRRELAGLGVDSAPRFRAYIAAQFGGVVSG